MTFDMAAAAKNVSPLKSDEGDKLSLSLQWDTKVAFFLLSIKVQLFPSPHSLLCTLLSVSVSLSLSWSKYPSEGHVCTQTHSFGHQHSHTSPSFFTHTPKELEGKDTGQNKHANKLILGNRPLYLFLFLWLKMVQKCYLLPEQ